MTHVDEDFIACEVPLSTIVDRYTFANSGEQKIEPNCIWKTIEKSPHNYQSCKILLFLVFIHLVITMQAKLAVS